MGTKGVKASTVGIKRSGCAGFTQLCVSLLWEKMLSWTFVELLLSVWIIVPFPTEIPSTAILVSPLSPRPPRIEASPLITVYNLLQINSELKSASQYLKSIFFFVSSLKNKDFCFQTCSRHVERSEELLLMGFWSLEVTEDAADVAAYFSMSWKPPCLPEFPCLREKKHQGNGLKMFSFGIQ